MRTAHAGQASSGIAACIALVACSDTAAPRAELLVVVDTDAHVVGEITSSSKVSPDATIDTLRVDVLDTSGKERDAHTFVVSSPSTWPISFGIEPPSDGSSEVVVRVRAFRALFAAAGTVNGGQATLDPTAEVTIDRLAVLSFPTSGVQTAAITLAADCMGVPASVGPKKTTCIDATRIAADPHEGVSESVGSGTKVGTWAPAFDVPCTSQPQPNQVCVNGRFTILGDLNAVGTTASQVSEEPVPLRPVVVAPFWLDETEFTVGHLRQLVQSGSFGATTPLPSMFKDPMLTDSAYCTWLGPGDGTNDNKPVNCIEYATAARACSLAGGRLPTEVEWEFAARGRGQRFKYPWGNSEPQCCTASLSRLGPEVAVECGPAEGIEDVGSHAVSASCASTGDATPDGAKDMGGSVIEVVSTLFAAYSDACWSSPAILRSPPDCAQGTVPSARGSYWNAGLPTAYSARRDSIAKSAAIGFRCASDGASP